MSGNVNLDLKAAIIRRFGSQLAFAQKVGVGELSVSKVINGRRLLNNADQKLWAKALNCKPGEIFSRK